MGKPLVAWGRKADRLVDMEREDVRRRVQELEPWVNEFTFEGVRYTSGLQLDYLLSQDPKDRARDFFAAFPGSRRILELGALEGADTLALSRYPDVSILALEGREANLRRAELVLDLHGVTNVELRLADVEALDFPALGTFDAVLCAGLLYHVRQPWTLLRDIARVTDHLYLSTHYWGSSAGLAATDGYTVKAVRENHPDPQTRGLSVDVRWLDRGSLMRALADAGFGRVDVRHERTSDQVCDLIAVCRTERTPAPVSW
ncbi:class I SAM-dependent methyltransferase [Micromonospora sp. LOL_015]|uniref:class I SAM-dependent methyltransferase n=1 Tax=Micromonospora sp. LOL_015 TaxID=3345416 RepID=UPI003A8C330B